MRRQLALVIRGSGYRGLRHLPKQGPAATNPPLPAWISGAPAPTPHQVSSGWALQLVGRAGFWCRDAVSGCDKGGGAGWWLGRRMDPPSLSVPDCPLGRSPAPYLDQYLGHDELLSLMSPCSSWGGGARPLLCL